MKLLYNMPSQKIFGGQFQFELNMRYKILQFYLLKVIQNGIYISSV